ncbi:MAG: hypothetical protein ACI4NO_00305 [Oxalobacter sp.]
MAMRGVDYMKDLELDLPGIPEYSAAVADDGELMLMRGFSDSKPGTPGKKPTPQEGFRIFRQLVKVIRDYIQHKQPYIIYIQNKSRVGKRKSLYTRIALHLARDGDLLIEHEDKVMLINTHHDSPCPRKPLTRNRYLS